MAKNARDSGNYIIIITVDTHTKIYKCYLSHTHAQFYQIQYNTTTVISHLVGLFNPSSSAAAGVLDRTSWQIFKLQ